jgi:hypothetical protein
VVAGSKVWRTRTQGYDQIRLLEKENIPVFYLFFGFMHATDCQPLLGFMIEGLWIAKSRLSRLKLYGTFVRYINNIGFLEDE